MKIESDCARKFQPVWSREDQENSARACVRSQIDHLKISRNRTGTLLRPNDKEEKRSYMKIPTSALSRRSGNLCMLAHALKIDLLGIGQNRTGMPIGQNDEYWKQSRVKIVTGALPEEPGN